MTSQIFYIYGFSLLLLSNVYAVYWNETEFLNVDGRDSRRIRNKLVTFDTTETDVEVAFQFNVPFVAVPTDRSFGGTKNSVERYELFETANSFGTVMDLYKSIPACFSWAFPRSDKEDRRQEIFSSTGDFEDHLGGQVSMVNLNLGSIALTGVMIAFGSLTSFLWSFLVPKLSSMTNNNDDPNTTNANTTTDSTDSIDDIDGNTSTAEESPKSERAYESNKFFYLMDLLDATVNPVVCVQQYICSLRKLSAKNVAEGCAQSSDKIIDGIFEARWVLDLISGTAVHDAIQFGESRSDCEKRFSKCGFESMRPEDVSIILLKFLRIFAPK